MAAESIALSKRTAVAGVWTIGARLLAKGVDFAALILLARFLGPGDFGLVAMAMTLIFVIEAISELPLSVAMTRIHAPTPSMYNTAFTISTLRGLVIGLIVSAVAWPMAHFYNEPRLVPLVSTLALAPIFRGLMSPRIVDYIKQMDFRRQATLDVLSKLIAGIAAVTTAALTHSYWSMALGTVLTPAVWMVGTFIFAPMRPRLTLRDWPVFADMVGWNVLSQTLQALNWQIGRLVLPRFVDTVSFGRYAVASDLSAIPYQILIAPLGFPLNVAFVHSHQKGDLKSTYIKASVAIVILMLPAYSFLALLSAPLIDLFLGSKWEAAGILLSGLALSTILQAPSMPMPSLATALNQSRRITMRTLAQFVIVIPIMVLGVWLFGVTGAVVANCLDSLIVLIVSMLAVKKMIGVGLREQLTALSGPVIAGAVSALVLFYASRMFVPEGSFIMQFLQIAVLGLLYLCVYAGGIYLASRWLKSTAGAEQMIIGMGLSTFGKVRRVAFRG